MQTVLQFTTTDGPARDLGVRLICWLVHDEDAATDPVIVALLAVEDEFVARYVETRRT